MTANAVRGFLPSTHGFHFVNRWPAGPAFVRQLGLVTIGIGDVGRGLCGGMGFATRDRFERGEAPPPDREPPQPGSALFREIAHRQLDSFDRLAMVPIRFWWLAATTRSGADRARASARTAWPAIRAEIDAGRLAMVGLVRSGSIDPLRLTGNHQAVAYAYEATADRATIRIYDPNHPDRDDIELRLTVERGTDGGTAPDRRATRVSLEQSTGEPLLGLLRLPYRQPNPPR